MNTWYDFIWKQLVPLGCIVALPNDYTSSNTTDENKCAITQRYVLDWIKGCNPNQTCRLYQKIGHESIAIGHSLGGGVTFLSSSYNYPLQQTFKYSFNAAFTLSGCGDTHDIMQAVQYIDIPVFIFTASNDCMCAPNDTAMIYYQMVPNDTCKFIADISNGTHCGFMDAPPFHQDICNVIDTGLCPLHTHQNVPLQVQIDIAMKYLTLFVNATMKSSNNTGAFKQIAKQLQKDTKDGSLVLSNDNC